MQFFTFCDVVLLLLRLFCTLCDVDNTGTLQFSNYPLKMAMVKSKLP